MEKTRFIRIQEELHGMFTDNDGNLNITYSRMKERNTLHFAVNTVVTDHMAGSHNFDKDGNFKGKIAIIVKPEEAPIPAGFRQEDTWFRMGNIEGQEDVRGVNVGKAVIVAPYGTENLPEGIQVLFYNGTIEQRDEVIKTHIEGQGVKFEKCGEKSWNSMSESSAYEWVQSRAKELYGNDAKFITHSLHSNSLDSKVEDNFFKILKTINEIETNGILVENKSLMIDEKGIDVINRTIAENKKNIEAIIENTPPTDLPRIKDVYQEQIQLLGKYGNDARNVHQEKEKKENLDKGIHFINLAQEQLSKIEGNSKTFYIAKPNATQQDIFPISKDDLINKVAKGEIPDGSKIWNETMGSEWKNLNKIININRISIFKDDPYLKFNNGSSGNILQELKSLKESLPPGIPQSKPEEPEVIGLSTSLFKQQKEDKDKNKNQSHKSFRL